jgi:hypothetical protein
MLLSHVHTRLVLPGLAQLTDPDPPAPSAAHLCPDAERQCQAGPYGDHIGCTADFRTGYTPTEAPMLRKKTTIESMKLPTHAPVWTGFGMMKIRIKMMISSVDSHFGIQTD